MIRPQALRIELHIERLTLNGLDLRHQERFTAALEHELTALLAAGKLPPWVLRRGRLDLEHTRFEAAPGADPETAGAGLARSIAASVRDAVPPVAAEISIGEIGRPGNVAPGNVAPATATGADGAPGPPAAAPTSSAAAPAAAASAAPTSSGDAA